MKKFANRKTALWTALALSAVVSGSAFADGTNVTIYGTLDAGIVSVTNQANPAGGTASVTALNTGGLSPSILGFKGTEDLGGGLKANFNLEEHLFATTGAGGQWGGLFGRQANVGLSNNLGSIVLGKQYSPAVLAFAATDPRGLKETFSGLISWALTQNPLNGGAATAPGNSNSVIDVFLANAISLSTKVGDVSLSGAYSLGEVAGNTSANTVLSLGAVYNGPVTLSAAYQKDNGSTAAASGTQVEKYSFGAGYSFGDATVKGSYLNDKNTNAATGTELQNYQILSAGVDYRTAANNVATLAYYHSKNKDMTADTSNTWILSDEYSLSKRTTLYALVSGVNTGANYSSGAAFGVANNNTYLGAQGKNTTALELGVRHTF